MTTKRSFIIAGVIGVATLTLLSALQVGATKVEIDENLSVTPHIISFETVFPGEVHFKPVDISLSQSCKNDDKIIEIEYEIKQRPKPRIDNAYERKYCEDYPNDLSRCYPSLCPYLSKTPDGAPGNDTGVPAFHDPWASSSVAHGLLSKPGNDTDDHWIIDLHVPCFRGECDQRNDVPLEYQLDPSLNGETFGCDLIVNAVRVVKKDKPGDPEEPAEPATRSQGFWQNHTAFTSDMFQSKLGGNMTVGTSTHVRLVTNDPGNGQSRLFGAWFSSIPKKTTNASRGSVNSERMRLLQQLVTAKLNCVTFGCSADVQTKIAAADSAYASGIMGQMITLEHQLEDFNESGDGNPIPPALGPVGSATPSQSSDRANKVFWDDP